MKEDDNGYEYDDSGYICIDSLEEFNKWCKNGGWKDASDFEFTTGVGFDRIKGIPFITIHNRVFLQYEIN